MSSATFITSYQGYLLSTQLTDVDVLIIRVGWSLSGFSVKLLFPITSILFSLCSPHLKEWQFTLSKEWQFTLYLLEKRILT